MFQRNALTRRTDPLATFIDPFFDSGFFRPFWAERDEDAANRTWVPSVDLRQNDNEYAVIVDLPGLKRQDIQLTVEDNTLTISGERHFQSKENKDNYSRIERSYGKFSRSFSLPTNVDGEKVKAAFDDGVLTVKIPKLEQAKPRQIEIK